MRSLRFLPYAAQLLSLGGSALLTFGTAFLLIPTARGEFAIFMLIATLGGYVIGLGIPGQILQATAAGAYFDVRSLFKFLLPLSAGMGAILFLVLRLTEIFPFISTELLAVSCITMVGASIFNALSWTEFGRGKFAVSTAMRGIIPLCALIVLFLCLLLQLVTDLLVMAVASAYLMAQCMATLILWWRSRDILHHRSGYHGKGFFERLRLSGKYFASQTLTMILARLPTIGAGIWYGPSAVAVVSLALSVTELQSSLPQMRSAITFREVSKSGATVLSRRQLIPAIQVLGVGTCVVVLGSIIASNLLPDDYADLWILVLLMCPGVAAMALAASALNVLAVRAQFLLPSIVLAFGCVLALFSLSGGLGQFWGIASWSFLSLLVGIVLCKISLSNGDASGPGRTGVL